MKAPPVVVDPPEPPEDKSSAWETRWYVLMLLCGLAALVSIADRNPINTAMMAVLGFSAYLSWRDLRRERLRGEE